MKAYHFYGWETANIRDPQGLTPRDYYDLLSDVWCAETCAPRMRADWTPANRTLGQCSITAFLMQDLYGGSVLGVPLGDGNFHCFNVVDGCVFDLTSEQFGDVRLNYADCPEQSRAVHFAKEEKRQRYELLKAKLSAKVRITRNRSDVKAVISKMTEQDRDSVKDMMRGFYASPAILSNGSETIFDADINACVSENPYLEGFVFEKEGLMIGYAMIAHSFSTEFGKPCIWIEDLFLKEPYRGAGIGSQFFDDLRQRYPGHLFRLEVESENQRAIHVYQRNGFEVLPYLEMKSD